MMQSAEELWSINSPKESEEATKTTATTQPPPRLNIPTIVAGNGEVKDASDRRLARRIERQQRSLPPFSINNGINGYFLHHQSQQLMHQPYSGNGRRQSHDYPRVGGKGDEDGAYCYPTESSPDSTASSFSSSPSSAATSTSIDNGSVTNLPPTVPLLSTRRLPSTTSAAEPAATTTLFPSSVSVEEDPRRLLEMQSVNGMEWLRETSLRRLARMFRQYGGGKLPPTPPADIDRLQNIHRKVTGRTGSLLQLAANHQWAQRRVKVWSQNIMKKVKLVKD